MAYRWYCVYDNNASNWKDSEICSGHCKKLYSTKEKAQKAALYHVRRKNQNHSVYVEKVDGRNFRGWKIV